MKKGTKLRIVVSKGDELLNWAPLRKGQTVIYDEAPNKWTIIVLDWTGQTWRIRPKAVVEATP